MEKKLGCKKVNVITDWAACLHVGTWHQRLSLGHSHSWLDQKKQNCMLSGWAESESSTGEMGRNKALNVRDISKVILLEVSKERCGTDGVSPSQGRPSSLQYWEFQLQWHADMRQEAMKIIHNFRHVLVAVKTLRKETADIIFACFFRNIWGHRSVLRSCRKFGRQSASPATSVIWPGKWKNAFCKDRAEKYCLELHKLLRNLLPFLGVFRLKSFKWLPGLLYFCSM